MTQSTITLTAKDYKSEVKPTWCPGCGDFGVLNSIYNTLSTMKLAPDQTVVVSGIGCSSRLPHFVQTFGIHSLHGRALPLAQGLKMARPDLTIVAVGGDGDLFSIGAGHLIHAALRNIDITVVAMDNETYGLTKGQTSPTSPTGHVTKSTPYGLLASQFNPIATALSLNVSFVARGFSSKPKELATLVEQGIQHKGFSFIHVLSPCPTFYNTMDMWKTTVTPIPADHDIHNRAKAIELAMETQNPYVGIYFQEDRLTMDHAAHQLGQQAKTFDIEKYMRRYA